MPSGPSHISVDVLIFGGGIAGLWTLARLRKEGYSCLLLEANALGAGQTIASQGIIHGGIKYALGGQASAASRAIAEMPGIWRACLRGEGEVDLRGVEVLSERQYLWTTTGLVSRLAGVAASRVIRTSVDLLAPEFRPDWLRAAPSGVDAYAVGEPILDPYSLLSVLSHANQGRIAAYPLGESWMKGPVYASEAAGGGVIGAYVTRDLGYTQILISCKASVLCAGQGNASLLQAGVSNVGGSKSHNPCMQVRRLHMVMVRSTGGAHLPMIYGHCLGLSDKPRVTITSQRDAAGRTVWYVGGALAENGVDEPSSRLKERARREIQACLPWIDLVGTQWATFRVDRAEGAAAGKRPDEPVVRTVGRSIVVWPTKLAFAPLAAARVVDALRTMSIRPSQESRDFAELAEVLPIPPIAALPWNDNGVTTWS